MRKTIFTSLNRSCRRAAVRRTWLRRMAHRARQAGGAAVLAGGMTFAGVAEATQVINEDFETNPSTNTSWVFTSYGTADDFSASLHSGIPGGGSFYAWNPGQGATEHVVDFASTLTSAEQTAIAEGKARLNFDGWLAAYTAQDDHTRFTAEFFDGANGTGNSLGATTLVDGSQFTAADGVTEYVDAAGVLHAGDAGATFFNWKHYVSGQGIGVGSESVIIRYEGHTFTSNANDAYADNIKVDVVATENEQFLKLVVNKTTGSFTIENNSTDALDVNFYEIKSPSGSLSTGWNSLSDQNLDSIGTGAGETWDEAGGSSSEHLLEAFLSGSTNFATGGDSETLAGGYTGGNDGTQDLTFFYGLTDDSLLRGIVVYETGPGFDPADLNEDGFVDGLDLGIQLGNFNQVADASGGELNGTPPVDGLDLGILLGAWSPPAVSGATAAVPEPTSLVLAGLGLAGVAVAGRRR